MPQSNRPNILLIMTDQQRGDCLGIDGHPVLMTPNMDSIAGQGVRCRHAYATCPSCAPARRSLMSGQFGARTGLVGYKDGVPWENPPPLLPQVLRDAGYQTAIVGRPMDLAPPRKRYGYEQMLLSSWRGNDEYQDTLQAHGVDAMDGPYGTGITHNDWTARPWHLDERLHPTHWTVSQALRWLQRRDPSAPFFLTVSFLAPHPPLVPPAFYFDRYWRQRLPSPHLGDWASAPHQDGRGDDVASPHVNLTGEALQCAQAGYFGLIHHVDDQLRRLLNPVTGVDAMTDRNTVVIFTSDHGEMLGDHFHWRKSVPYEGSARIPLLARAPKRFELTEGSTIDAPVCLEDIMPTVLDFANLPIPQSVDGQSLLPLMRGERPTWRTAVPIEHAPRHQCLTDGKEKYIWFTDTGEQQFFDLTSDPHELRNLVAVPDKRERVALWRQRLIERLADRAEAFTDGDQLLAGRTFAAERPNARVSLDAAHA